MRAILELSMSQGAGAAGFDASSYEARSEAAFRVTQSIQKQAA
jgi:hypothetical protein